MFRFLSTIPVIALFLQIVVAPGFAVDWTWRDPSPQGNILRSVAYSPTLDTTVAVGEFGTGVRKVGAAPWAAITASSSGQSLQSITWANNRFLAVGSEAGLRTSTDGTTWTTGQAGVSGSQIAGVTGQLVILSGDQVWISSDAVTWTSVVLPTPPVANSHYRGLAYLGGAFVAAGDKGLIARSVNGGQTWTIANGGVSSNLFSLTAGSGQFVAVGWYFTSGGVFTPQVVRSVDGLTWVLGTIPTPPAGNYFDIVFPIGSGFLAVGSSGIFNSADGSTWTAVAGSPTNFYPVAAVQAGVLGTVVVGNRGEIYILSPSLVWSRQTTGAITGTYLWTPRFSAAAVGSLILAKDDNREPAIYRSLDNGGSWTEKTGLDPFLTGLSSLKKIGNRIVAYSPGDSNSNPPQDPGFYSTTNGTSWTLVGLADLEGSPNALAANTDESVILTLTTEVTFDPSNYTAVRRLYRSTSWGTWVRVNLPALGQLPPQSDSVETLFWDGAKFVLLVYPGRIFTSTDGLNWIQLPALPLDSASKLAGYSPAGAPAANTAFSVASNGTILVARSEKLGSSGTPGYWTNGNARFFIFREGLWQESSVPVTSSSSDLYQIFWDGTKFLAPVPGRLLTSTDAIAWTDRKVGASLPVILPTGSALVGFSTEVAVLTHPDGLSDGAAVPYTSLAPSSRISVAEGEIFDLAVTSSESSWNAASNVPWLSVSATSGVGNAVLSITVQQNKTTMVRSGNITVGSASLTITQPPAKPYQPKPLAVGASVVTIPASGSWTALADQPWATISGSTGASGSGSLKINFAANPVPASRTVTVTLNGIPFTFTQAGNLKLLPVSYYGAVGEMGEILPPLLVGTNQPLAANFEWTTGSLAITVSPPTVKSPNGTYSATLNIFDATTNLVFKAKGSMGAGGVLENVTWKTTGKTPQSVLVSLAPLANGTGSEGLAGTVTFNEQVFDVLAGKQIYNQKTNPWPANENLYTVLLEDFAGATVSGAGTVSISTLGVAKVVARMNNGTTVTMSAPVWGATGDPAEKILFFYLPLPKNAGFLGGWLANTDGKLAPWQGGGTWKTAGTDNPMSTTLFPYTKPAAKTAAVSWPNGADLQVDNADFFFNATVHINSANKLSFAVAENSQSFTPSFTFAPATGLVSGKITYVPFVGDKSAVANLVGVLDQSTGQIRGFVTFSAANIGTLYIDPL